ncbi:solute carrier family 23 protein, partial [Staphylococcus arlettae]
MSIVKNSKYNCIKNEIITAIIAFFTCSYIIIVNSTLLEVAGMPLKWSIVATTIVCAISCILVGAYAKVPFIIIPGVGETIFFTFTVVKSHNYTYQEALVVVLFSGIIFLFISFTPLVSKMNFSIPDSLKTGITIGIGLFMAFVGLQNSGILVGNKQTMVSLNEWNLTLVIALLVLLISLILFTAKIKLAFLYTIIIGSIISFLTGVA